MSLNKTPVESSLQGTQKIVSAEESEGHVAEYFFYVCVLLSLKDYVHYLLLLSLLISTECIVSE
jgi:hypothetical protein